MKASFIALFALVATAVAAPVNNERDAAPQCGGLPCWKREAEAEAVVEREAEADPQWSGGPCGGVPCWKREAEAEAEAEVVEREASPQWGGGPCGGSPCW